MVRSPVMERYASPRCLQTAQRPPRHAVVRAWAGFMWEESGGSCWTSQINTCRPNFEVYAGTGGGHTEMDSARRKRRNTLRGTLSTMACLR